MKRLTRYAAIVLALVAAPVMLVACDFKDHTAQPSCYEIDVDAPKVKKPTGPKVTAPALRTPKVK